MLHSRSILFVFIPFVFISLACAFSGRKSTVPAATDLATQIPTSTSEPLLSVSELPSTNTLAPSGTSVLLDMPTASPTVVPTIDSFPTVNPWDGAEVSWIPAGGFLMGADPGSPDFWGAEYPAHTVVLDAFVIYRNEVTNAMYRQCIKAGICSDPKKFQSPSSLSYFSNKIFDNYPVIYVSYTDAVTYCQWAGGRLPTEAEWEKAARGDDGRLYPWGNDSLDATRANFCGAGCSLNAASAVLDDGYPDLAPVGSFPTGTSPYDVNDMAGNVLEWVFDWFQADYYLNSPAENPIGPNGGSQHVVRGGSWFNDQSALRTVARASLNPDDTVDTVGFRCVLPADVSQWRSGVARTPETPTPHIEPESAPAINAKDGADLIFIPAGDFIMGVDSNSPDFWGAEAPAHLVTLDSYLIYRTEVTNAMYLDCFEVGDCSLPITTSSRTRPDYFGSARFADYPIVSISYDAAATYCRWAGARLPTEAEWEKAARGEDGRLYPWGNDVPDISRVNFCPQGCPDMSAEEAKQEGSPDTKPVGSYPVGASPYGVMDMAGNVLEWVVDWFQADYYANAPLVNPFGPEQGDQRVLRGGSWYSGASALRSVARSSESPDLAFNTIGFRCVVDLAR